jgi:hypothetical protein
VVESPVEGIGFFVAQERSTVPVAAIPWTAKDSRRTEFDIPKIRAGLNTPCPYCGHGITPEERTHVDTEHLECPKCKKRFIRGKPDNCLLSPGAFLRLFLHRPAGFTPSSESAAQVGNMLQAHLLGGVRSKC